MAQKRTAAVSASAATFAPTPKRPVVSGLKWATARDLEAWLEIINHDMKGLATKLFDRGYHHIEALDAITIVFVLIVMSYMYVPNVCAFAVGQLSQPAKPSWEPRGPRCRRWGRGYSVHVFAKTLWCDVCNCASIIFGTQSLCFSFIYCFLFVWCLVALLLFVTSCPLMASLGLGGSSRGSRGHVTFPSAER